MLKQAYIYFGMDYEEQLLALLSAEQMQNLTDRHRVSIILTNKATARKREETACLPLWRKATQK